MSAFSAPLAQKHGACLWCSTDRQVHWHDGPCPQHGRERAVGCAVPGCGFDAWEGELCPVHKRRQVTT